MMALTLGINAGFAQTGTKTSPEQLLRDGIAFYSEGKFSETIGVLRRVPSGAGHYPEALYWISLAEISSGDYEQALLDLDALAKADPRGRWVEEIPYHRGRSLFYLARYEEAFLILKNYTDRPDEKALSRKDSAYYWMGECLLALGQLDSAANAFSVVVEKYPSSAKYEASSYRLELINQKKIEAELLSILKWTHEESLKTLEEYQTREKTYDQAIAAYQRRLSGTEENGLTEPERVGLYRDRLEAAEQRIAGLEASLAEANAALIELRGSGVRSSGSGSPSSSLDDTERTLKLLEIKAAALELSNALNNRLRTLGGER
jgi:tetratricopeptide (TPR) repeat protein